MLSQKIFYIIVHQIGPSSAFVEEVTCDFLKKIWRQRLMPQNSIASLHNKYTKLCFDKISSDGSSVEVIFTFCQFCLIYCFLIRFKNPVKWILCIKTWTSNWIENRNFNFFCHQIVARRDLVKMYLCAMIKTICTS